MKIAVALLACLTFALPVSAQNQPLDEETRREIREIVVAIDNYLGASPTSTTQRISGISSPQSNLEDKVEACKVVNLTVRLLSEKPAPEVTPELAALVLHGLTQTCGFMNGELRQEVNRAITRGELTMQEAEKFFEPIAFAERAGWQYQGRLHSR
ncbi:MAG: hypothetical protein WDZ61_00520 [Parcubacteria group bacterium]